MADTIDVTLQLEGIENIDQLKAKIKELQAEFNASDFGTAKFQAAGQALVQHKEALSQMRTAVQTENGAMMQSYFSLGESIRSIQSIALGFLAAFAATKEAVAFSEEASRIQMLREEIEKFGQEKGFNAVALMGQLQESTHGTVKEIDLLQIALQSIRLGNIDLNKLPEIMERLNHYAELMGEKPSRCF